MKRRVIATVLAVLMLATPTYACDTLRKGSATVYSIEGKTALGTDTRYGVCATGDKSLLGKQIILYQRKPDETKGECLGIFTVEDTGCKQEVIDIWCPESYQQMIIGRTYENGCKGKIYIQIL